jgi:hypothetical protein
MPESPGPTPADLILQPAGHRPPLWSRVTAAAQRLFHRPAWLLGVAGVALLAAGVVRVIAIASGAGLTTVIVAGGVLLISPFIIGRIQRLSVGTSGLDLQLAKDMADLGAPKAAQILDNTDLAKFAESYAFVHKELEDHQYYHAKIHLQDLLVERASALASAEKFDATEVRRLFANAAPTMRVLVIGLMQGDCSLADGPTVLAAVADPRTKNEQYQGLVLAKLCWRRLGKADRAALKYVIRTDPEIGQSTSRRLAAQEVLALPDSPEGAVLGT